MTLAEVLDQYVPEGQVIDFLSIDVEGMDDRCASLERLDTVSTAVGIGRGRLLSRL